MSLICCSYVTLLFEAVLQLTLFRGPGRPSRPFLLPLCLLSDALFQLLALNLHFGENLMKSGPKLKKYQYLIFTSLWANSADDKLMLFFFYFSQKTGFDISCKLCQWSRIILAIFVKKQIRNNSVLKWERCCLQCFLFLALAAILCSRVEPFKQFW